MSENLRWLGSGAQKNIGQMMAVPAGVNARAHMTMNMSVGNDKRESGRSVWARARARAVPGTGCLKKDLVGLGRLLEC